MKTKRFAVRIQEGARPHLKIVNATSPDEAAIKVIGRLDCEGDRLLGARISVWEHGTLQKNTSPLFIKSVQPFETTPDIHVVQEIREDVRRGRWLATRALAEEEKSRKSHLFEEPYAKWLEEHCSEQNHSFFSLPMKARRECMELRDYLKHVSPGQMTEVQARFAAVVSSFADLYHHEMYTLHEHLVATLEMIHHLHEGRTDGSVANGEEMAQVDRLAHMIGGTVPNRENVAGPAAI